MGAPDRNKLAAERWSLADAVIVDNPRAREAHATFEFMIDHGKYRPSGSKLGVFLIAPSQTGKTTIINTFANSKNTAEALNERRIPVLVVTLDANVTRKGLAENILEALEEHGFQTGPHTGSETNLLRRVRVYLAAAKVELLILDEIHHLVHSESQKLAKSVSETIKRMLIKGICPIVMSGIEDARRLHQANSQLSQRCQPTIDLKPLEANPADLTLFTRFLEGYCEKLVKIGAIGHSPDLETDDAALCILEVSRGILGAACNLIKHAIYFAALAGRHTVTLADLSQATDRAFVAAGLYERNPFSTGFRSLSIVRKRGR